MRAAFCREKWLLNIEYVGYGYMSGPHNTLIGVKGVFNSGRQLCCLLRYCCEKCLILLNIEYVGYGYMSGPHNTLIGVKGVLAPLLPMKGFMPLTSHTMQECVVQRIDLLIP
jgi:hypothetical protein